MSFDKLSNITLHLKIKYQNFKKCSSVSLRKVTLDTP